MAADVEDSVELGDLGGDIGQLDGVGPESLLLFQELGRGGVALEHLHGAGVERGLATLGGGDDQLGLLMENFPGVSELGLLIVSVARRHRN